MKKNVAYPVVLFALLFLVIGLFFLAQTSRETDQRAASTGKELSVDAERETEAVPGAGHTASTGETERSPAPSPDDDFAPEPAVTEAAGPDADGTGTRAEPSDPAATRSVADILEGADLTDPVVRDQVVRQVRERELADRQEMLDKARRLGFPIRIELEDGRIMELMGFDGDEPLYRTTHNVSAAISSGADKLRLNPYNLSGAGVSVGVWDGGSARSSHQELDHNTSLENSGAQLSDHATHVAGTIGASGIRSEARGMAPSVNLLSYDWNSDLTEMLASGAANASDTGRVSLSNHSYGIIVGYMWDGSQWRWYGDGTGSGGVEEDFGRYSSLSREWDAVAHSLPYLTIFKAAGNDRNDTPGNGEGIYSPDGSFLFTYASNSSPKGDGDYRSGFESQAFVALAKNVITVGAVTDAVSANTRSVAASGMSSFSCWGPVDDGRIKPDLVANGVDLESPVASGDAAYDSYSGTSMATPSASGSAALLMELYRNEFAVGLMRSSTLKGLLIHTADDVGLPGPDYQNGWGLINVEAAADLLLAHKASMARPRLIEATVTTAATTFTHEFEWDGTAPIRATLCWTDPAGSSVSGHDTRTPTLVNDLDLTLTGPNGSVYRPYVMPFVGNWTAGAMNQPAVTGRNEVDNVEQVLIQAPPQAGNYTVTITVDGPLTNGRQSFSLLLSGVAAGSGNAAGGILRLNGNLTFGAVEVGQSASRPVTLQNIGNEALSVSGIELPSGFAGEWSGTLAAGASASFDVTFSPAGTGPVSGSLRALSDADNGVVTLAVSGEGIAATVIQPLSNGVAVSGLSGLTGSERYYRISVPVNQSELRFQMNGTGDADLYVRFGGLPTLSAWDYRPYVSNSSEEVVVAGPSAGDWYVMIRGYTAYSELRLVASHQASTLSSRVIELQGELDYGNIPVGDVVRRNLTIRNTGNSPLTVTGISLPAGFSGNWSGLISSGSSQDVEIAFAPVAEQVYLGQITVASDKTSGIHTRGVSGTGVITQIGLQNGVTAGPFSSLAASLSTFYIDVPSGQSSLTVQLQGADGEADLYVRYGSAPTLQAFDFRSSDPGHDDTVTVDTPSAGRWFILLHSVTQTTEIRLSAEYRESAATRRIIRLSGNLSFGEVRVNQTAIRDVTLHNDGDVGLTVFSLSVPGGFSASWSGLVQPGQSRTVPVSFSPTDALSYSGTLSVQSDATSGASTASLSGQGVAQDSITDLENGIPLLGLDGSTDSQRLYRLQIPSGATLLSVSIAGSSGDADLYLRYGAAPTLEVFDFRPYLSDSNESVDVVSPAAGDWYVMVNGYTQYSGLTLRASYVVGTGGGETQFTNTQAVVLDDSGPASLYPSSIAVSGLSGSIQTVRVRLHGLTHTYPSDIDLLLVSPDGTSVLLMSDAGGGTDVSNLELVFDDDASSPLSESSPLSSGVYRPTNFDSDDVFPSPAPGDPYAATLSAVAGLNPNGNWLLYVVDDTGLDSGSLAGGWTLEIQTNLNSPALPDLTDGSGAHNLSPATASVGDQMTFSVDIANQGGLPSGAFEVRLLFSVDETFSDSDTAADIIAVANVDAGAVHVVDTTFAVPVLPAGQYYLGWQIDTSDAVAESDETNNDWYRTTPVQISLARADDAYEENDTIATAYAFLPEGTWLSEVSGPGIQADEDWYAIGVSAGDILQVSCLFTHDEGDIDIALYNANGELVENAFSVSESDDEAFEVSIPMTGTYYLLVYYGNSANRYDLRWQTFTTRLAPDAETVAALIPGQTLFGSLFTSATRFDWEGYTGNWSYERVSATEGLLVQTYDAFGNDPGLYREELRLTFVSATSGVFLYRIIDQGTVTYEETDTFDFPWLENTPAAWYDDSFDAGGGWRWYDWLGYFSVTRDPWIYHLEHGWLYSFATGPQSVFFWEVEMNTILWTSESVYPTIYRYSDAQWIYYLKGSRNPRWFVNLATGQWEQW